MAAHQATHNRNRKPPSRWQVIVADVAVYGLVFGILGVIIAGLLR